MGRLSAQDMIAHTGMRVALEWHLQHNHFPPVPRSMLRPCQQAIALANAEDWDARVTLPDGITWKGETTAPVHAIISAHHLEPFLDVEETDE